MEKNGSVSGRFTVYLADLTHKNSLGLGSDTMPFQLGILGACLLERFSSSIEVELFKSVDEFSAKVAISPPNLVGFSNYMWNANLTYAVAEALKRRHPETVVVFGGPNYPDTVEEQAEWLRNRPAVDIFLWKDGEIAFTDLVNELMHCPVSEAKAKRLASCHSLDANGQPCFGELAPRLKDLCSLPAPYLSGLMDKFFDQRLIPAMQTNRGCPFSCTFCTEGNRYYNPIGKRSLEQKKADLDYIAARAKHTKTLRISDSNFGMFPEDLEFARYMSESQRTRGYPLYVNCATGKNKKELVLEINALLNNAMRLTASVQSLSPRVLKLTNRSNISIEQIMALSDQVSDTDTHSYSEIILGLPGDDFEAECLSVAGLVDAGISNITQHQCALIYGSELNTPASRALHGLKSKFRPIQRCLGRYICFGEEIVSVETEEIITASSSMTESEYLEGRKLYLTVGLFYNDRTFGEINALLRLLKRSTWEWLKLIHDSIDEMPESLKQLYLGFIAETKAELWDDPKTLNLGIKAMIDRYASGEIGGNLIYKYRAGGVVHNFQDLHRFAYAKLRLYLAEELKEPEIRLLLDELEQLGWLQKKEFFDTGQNTVLDCRFDLPGIIHEAARARISHWQGFKKTTTIEIAHTQAQKEAIDRELAFYGRDGNGLTLLFSRFPLKRLFRSIRPLD